MNKNLIYFFTVFIILPIVFFSCSEKGVYWGLDGTWELTDYDFERDSYWDDVEGTLIIYSNDTYDFDTTYKKNDKEFKDRDTGTLKACSINKFIQFFSDKDDDRDMNYRYNLDYNTLILESDKNDVRFTFQKIR